MSIEDAINRTTLSVFGRAVSYVPKGQPAVTIHGVFSREWVEVDNVQSLASVLRVALADLPKKPGKGDQVIIGEDTYSVSESHEDAFGMTSLILKKA